MFDNFILKYFDKKKKIMGYEWEPDDPPGAIVLLVHGIGEYAARYARVASCFAEKGIKIMAIDLRGHGISDGKKGDCAPRDKVLGDLDDLYEYAEKKYPGIPKAMYGHSMGGGIALDYRVRGRYNDKMKAYVISAPWILLKDMPTPGKIRLVKAVAKVFPTLTVSSDVDEEALGNLEMVRPYSSDPLIHNSISTRCAVDGFTRGMKLAEGNYTISKEVLRIPTLLMHGSKDKICDVEGSRLFATHEKAMALGMENGASAFKYEELPGYFHEIHNGNDAEDGTEVILRMREFLSKTVLGE